MTTVEYYVGARHATADEGCRRPPEYKCARLVLGFHRALADQHFVRGPKCIEPDRHPAVRPRM